MDELANLAGFLGANYPLGPLWYPNDGLLNGVSLDRQLVRCYNGFFVQVSITASPWVLGELSQNAPLVTDTLHTAGSYPFSERILRTIVYIAGGGSLILSRCFVTEAPPIRSEIIQGIGRRFPDLTVENIGLAEVHPSMHTINPVAHPGTLCYVVTPVDVKTTLERCGPFSLVVLSQRRSQVTPLSGHSDQNASERFSNKLQLNKVQSSLRQTSAKTTQVRSKAKTS